MHFFPFGGVNQPMMDHYNELSRYEIERIRDFVCMHYHYTQRDDTPFWRHCREMEIPDSLRERVELFRQGGYAYKVDGELFTVDSWISVMMGQHIEPETYHHFAQRQRPRAQGLHGEVSRAGGAGGERAAGACATS